MKKTIVMLCIAIFGSMLMSCTKDNINETFDNINPTSNQRVMTVKAINTIAPGCSATVNNVPLTVTGNVYTCLYQFGTISDTVLVEFVDNNGGNIVNGDTINFNYIKFTTCGVRHMIRTDNYSIANSTILGVTIYYTDCMLPLNGTNGEITIKLKH